MKKRLWTGLVCLCLLLSLTLPALAAVSGMQNFSAARTYSGAFQDVPSSNWAAPSIRICYELGLMNGSSETAFQPQGELTVAEAVAMADRVHSIYHTGVCKLQNGTPWYQPYLDYAVANGIMAQTDFADPNAKITRAQMAYLFHNTLPESELPAINVILSLPDVDAGTPYHYEITALYAAGVLTGSNAYGTFSPDQHITRAEAAAIIARVADPGARKTFTLTPMQTTEAIQTPASAQSTDPAAAGELSAQEIYKRCAPAVALFTVYDSYGYALATGSGFFIDAAGTFVTNYHVIEGGAAADITTTDGQVYNVEGVYDCRADYDVALLKIAGSGFPFLGLDTVPATGSTVYAIGSPLGLDNTISSGIVSNASRSIGDGMAYIQTTAPISSGSSGGALINTAGRVVGITSAALDVDGSVSQNLNLAIPVSYLDSLGRTSVSPMTRVTGGAAGSQSGGVISASQTSITLNVGQTQTIYITQTSTEGITLCVESLDPDVADCSFGDWQDENETIVALTIEGYTSGTTSVAVYYEDGWPSDSYALIDVTVLSPAPNSTGETTYYTPAYVSPDGWNSWGFQIAADEANIENGYIFNDQYDCTYYTITGDTECWVYLLDNYGEPYWVQWSAYDFITYLQAVDEIAVDLEVRGNTVTYISEIYVY